MKANAESCISSYAGTHKSTLTQTVSLPVKYRRFWCLHKADQTWSHGATYGSPSGEMEPFARATWRAANRNKRAMTSSSVPQATVNDSSRQSRESSNSGTVALIYCPVSLSAIKHTCDIHTCMCAETERDSDCASTSCIKVIDYGDSASSAHWFFFSRFCDPSHPRCKNVRLILV